MNIKKSITHNIIIYCPGNVITGGVNSLHNLCKSLNDCHFKARMYYFNADEKVLQNHQITSYQVQRVRHVPDKPDTMVIVPETLVHLLLKYEQAKKVVYWLALKYYFKNPTWRFPFNMKVFRTLISCRSYAGFSSGVIENKKRRLNEFAKSHVDIWNNNVIHISNSFFVANYCKSKGAKQVYVLHNPIRQEFYDYVADYGKREKLVLFGPKTPKRIIIKLKKQLPGYNIIRLKKIPFEKVFDLMTKAIIFAEFGNYPGRDRMPREAVMLGCGIFMNKRGPAALKEDYDIPDYYKIADTRHNFPTIIKRMVSFINNYETRIEDFKPFKKILRREKENFIDNTQKVFGKITANK